MCKHTRYNGIFTCSVIFLDSASVCSESILDTLTEAQMIDLDRSFASGHFLDLGSQQELASRLGLPEHQVQVHNNQLRFIDLTIISALNKFYLIWPEIFSHRYCIHDIT